MIVSLVKFANGTLYSTAASLASTPSPPAFVIMAIPGFFGIGQREKAFVASNNSSIELTRIIPDCLNAASEAASDPASAPVLEEAAFAPISVRPALSTTSGVILDTSFAVSYTHLTLPTNRE